MTPKYAPRKIRWAIVLYLVAFTGIALLSDQIYERIPNSEDEAAYLFQAQVFAHNRLTVPTPPNADAFWSPFVVDYQGRRFGKYPPGWPLLLSFGIRLGMPWLVNAILAVLTLGLITRLGSVFYQDNTGFWAAILALNTPGFLFLSSSLLSHPASLWWSALALLLTYYLVTWAQANPKAKITAYGLHPNHIALLLGVALGASFITRPFAGLGLGLTIGLFLLILTIRDDVGASIFVGLVGGGLLVAALLPLYWWLVSGDPTFNPYLLVWPYDRVGFGPDIGPQGYNLQTALFINTKLKLIALATGLFGWPGWSNLLFLPLPFILRRATRWDWLLLGTLLVLIFVHIFYWAFGGVDGGFPRYYYDALPALLLLTVRGIQVSMICLSRWIGGGVQKRLKGLVYAPIVVAMAFTIYSLIWRWPDMLRAQKDKYGISAASLDAVEQANIATPALVLVKGIHSWSDFAAPFAANDPLLEAPIIYAIDWDTPLTEQVRAQFAERDCWELETMVLKPCIPPPQ